MSASSKAVCEVMNRRIAQLERRCKMLRNLYRWEIENLEYRINELDESNDELADEAYEAREMKEKYRYIAWSYLHRSAVGQDVEGC